jgi:hypothetical protein
LVATGIAGLVFNTERCAERSSTSSITWSDAPGKKHRPPMPTDPGANRVDSQSAKMRDAKTMVKTFRRRGRG